MITLLANIENNIAEFLEDFDFYLFVISNDCDEYKYLLEPTEVCDTLKLFSINVDIQSGNYELSIYGGNEETETINDKELLLVESLKIYNPLNECFNVGYLLDENGYILADFDGTKILY
jgi:hypothetical protein